MNKYFGVIFKSKEELEKEETFIVSQDLIKRGVVESLFVKIDDSFIQITEQMTILEWIKQSDDKNIYISNNGTFERIDINDISFEDYIKIYNKNINEIGFFIIDKYITNKGERCNYFLSMKTDEIDNKIYCEYYNRNSKEFVYTERVIGLDKIITDEQLKEKIRLMFEKYKKENL